MSTSIHCDNCGAEIFDGQRFCRSCGRPTNPEENAPTQAMPPSAAAGVQRSPIDTAPPRPYTSPVYQPPGYYQTPQVRPPMPTYTPPQARSGWGWIVGIIGVVILSLVTMGIFVIRRVARRPDRRIPPVPATRADLRDLGNGTETVSENETTIMRSFPLSASARFALQNASGNITIEGWDKSQAEVITIKRGGSAQDRSNLKVGVLTDGGNLSLQTPSARGIDVEYIVKLPQKLAEVSLESASSDIQVAGISGKVTVKSKSGDINLSRIKGNLSVATASGSTELSDVSGDVSVSSASGDMELTDVDGAIEVKTASGDIGVVFDSVVPAKPLRFESATGDIEIKLAKIPDANFTAETLSGNVDIDEALRADTTIAGRRFTGRLGKGGLPLIIKTVTGTIKITK